MRRMHETHTCEEVMLKMERWIAEHRQVGACVCARFLGGEGRGKGSKVTDTGVYGHGVVQIRVCMGTGTYGVKE